MKNNEMLLHYAWKHRLYKQGRLVTTIGLPINVIDVGLHNSDAGPDFFNAKIRIGDTLWAGNVEIHVSSDDWYKHKHNTDRTYNSVILHVVEVDKGDVKNEAGITIPQLVIQVPPQIKENYRSLLQSSEPIPCSKQIRSIRKHIVGMWMDALALERMERKVGDIYAHLHRFTNSWDQAFYVMLARNFGFGLNADAFERLALRLPFSFILRHNDSLFQVEALLFGQAGMLEDKTVLDDYFFALKTEYSFLQKKYSLRPMDKTLFKRMRLRPNAFPEIRIAQLATLLCRCGRLLSTLLDKENYKQIRLHFQSNASAYWQSHFCFGKSSPKSTKYLGDASLDNLLVNTVAPILFAYGRKMGQDKYCDRAISIWESIKPEKNSIITRYVDLGIKPQNAFESQALTQLYNEYCLKRKCFFCKIGYEILADKNHCLVLNNVTSVIK